MKGAGTNGPHDPQGEGAAASEVTTAGLAEEAAASEETVKPHAPSELTTAETLAPAVSARCKNSFF